MHHLWHPITSNGIPWHPTDKIWWRSASHGDVEVAATGYYGDQTQGLGPEVIALAATRPGRYCIGAKYFSTGAMGASRGTVLVRQMSNGKVMGEAGQREGELWVVMWIHEIIHCFVV